MSSDPKSISSGLSLPKWMKRLENRFDGDGSTFSPPAHDESFFYIRYPLKNDDKSSTTNEKQGSITSALQQSGALAAQPKQQPEPVPSSSSSGPIVVQASNTTTTTTSSISSTSKVIDFSKHTDPCRKFIGDHIATPIKGQTKSQGTDDGFKDAVCGSSLLKVAHKVVSSGKQFGRGFTVANIYSEEAEVEPETTLKDSEDQQMSQSARNMMRRGSKSLPASPMGSPKSVRKVNYNPYFTTHAQGATETVSRGWFLSSLLGAQREQISTTSTHSVSSQIDEEAEEIYENNNNNNNTTTAFAKKTTNPPVLKAKPSQLREMNFWSPTSM